MWHERGCGFKWRCGRFSELLDRRRILIRRYFEGKVIWRVIAIRTAMRGALQANVYHPALAFATVIAIGS